MATKTWNGSNGALSLDGGWSSQLAPGSGDVAVINAGTVTATGTLPGSLQINLDASGNVKATLALAVATLPTTVRVNITAAGTDATLRVSGTVINQGTITVAGASPGVAFIRIDNGPGGSATSFVNTGSIQVDDTGLQVVSGGNPGNQFENDGLVSIRSASLTPQLAVMSVNLTGAGTVALGSYVTFDAVQAVGAGQTVLFERGTGGMTTLRMEAGRLFAAAISGFATSDTIELNSGRWDTAAYASTGANSGVLTLSLRGAVAKSIVFNGLYTIDSFKLVETAPVGSSHAATTITVDDPLFDSAYYLAHNADVAAAGVDPYQHFMAYGWKEGRNPDGYFDLAYYRSHNPDVAAAGVNLLSHFEQYGWKEGREPGLSFSDSRYLAANPDVGAAGLNPLLHFERLGKYEGRATFLSGSAAPADLLVDADYYDRQLGVTIVPPGIAGQQQAAWSYGTYGSQHGLNPDAYFDTRYYSTQNPDVKTNGQDPLPHFEQYGWKEGRDPSLMFSDSKYLAANPDVMAAGANPLLHYIQYGQSEGRLAFLSGGMDVADPLINAEYFDRQLGATLIPTGVAAQQQSASTFNLIGWQQGLNPDAYFDTKYYLGQNPDVAAVHVNPVSHYEQYGWREGRNPSAQFSTNKYLAANLDVKAVGLNPLEHFLTYGQAEGRAAFAV